jgi:hypothetical protein
VSEREILAARLNRIARMYVRLLGVYQDLSRIVTVCKGSTY